MTSASRARGTRSMRMSLMSRRMPTVVKSTMMAKMTVHMGSANSHQRLPPCKGTTI